MWVERGGCGWWEHVCASIVYRCSHMCIVCVLCVCACVRARMCCVCVYMCVVCVFCVCVCMCVFVVVCVLCGVNVCCERGGGVWKE